MDSDSASGYRMNSVREESYKTVDMAENIKDLTLTVDRLSRKMEDFIETTSEVLSLGSRYPGSRQGNIEAYGTLPSTVRSKKSLIDQDQIGIDDVNIYLPPKKVDYSVDENEKRGNWSGRFEFLLSCLGCAVGLGNVWRFPYKCYVNGGGAFLIPYTIMLIFVGIPIFLIELALGQYTSQGCMSCWGYAPMFQGIGWAMLLVSAFVCVYYNMIIAWALFYLGASFSELPNLPWDNCDADWATENCFLKIPDMNCTGDTYFKSPDGRCFNGTDNTGQLIGLWNDTLAKTEAGIVRQFASEQYFSNYVLGQTDSIEDLGKIRWQLVLALMGAWVLVFLCLVKGIKSSGKVVYFTALFPYIVLVILLIRGVTLEGHFEGIKFYMIPDWNKLSEAQVWSDAATQIFFSLSASWGGLITLSSYNRFNNNILRDTFLVTIGNCLTSVFAGFVIFSFLGAMAHEIGKPVGEVAAAGTGLAFIVYPKAVTSLPASPLWAILFFLMLVTLGLDSQFALMETVITGLMDNWPKYFPRKHKTWIVFFCCVLLFLPGLVLCTEGGVYVLQVLDSYAGGWAVLFIGLSECISIAWFYGWYNFSHDIELMIGKKPWLWWWLMWYMVSPFIITYVMLFSWVDYAPVKYDDYVLPTYANVIGWVITLIVFLPIPIGIIVTCIAAPGSCMQRFKKISRPSKEWGPSLVRHRSLAKHLKNIELDPWNEIQEKRRNEFGTSSFASAKRSGSKTFSHDAGRDNVAFNDLDAKLN